LFLGLVVILFWRGLVQTYCRQTKKQRKENDSRNIVVVQALYVCGVLKFSFTGDNQ